MASFPTPHSEAASGPASLPPYPGQYIPDQIPPDGPQIGPLDPVNIPDGGQPDRDIEHGPEDEIDTPEVETDDEVDAVDNDSGIGTAVSDAGDTSEENDDAGRGDSDDGGGGDGGSGDNS